MVQYVNVSNASQAVIGNIARETLAPMWSPNCYADLIVAGAGEESGLETR